MQKIRQVFATGCLWVFIKSIGVGTTMFHIYSMESIWLSSFRKW